MANYCTVLMANMQQEPSINKIPVKFTAVYLSYKKPGLKYRPASYRNGEGYL